MVFPICFPGPFLVAFPGCDWSIITDRRHFHPEVEKSVRKTAILKTILEDKITGEQVDSQESHGFPVFSCAS
jgi:hypothetical protein